MTRFFLAGLALGCLGALPAAAEPATYATPQDALMTLVAALQAKDRDAVLAVFGPENEDLISDGDPAEDRRNNLKFLQLYGEGFRFVPQEDGSFVIAMGKDGWPFPVPVAKSADGWAFDSEAGRIEVRDRELGLNELEVIDLMDAYGDIQAAFRLRDMDGDGVMEFASRIISSPDQRDGLFWAGPDSPLGEVFARATAEGFNDGEADHPPEPYLGYLYRILTAQGAGAPGGAMDYMVNGNMVAGHALLATPAEYGVTGVFSFMVSENGIILQADLGDDTAEVAAATNAYEPGPDWAPVK